jgi:hypothetical protein
MYFIITISDIQQTWWLSSSMAQPRIDVILSRDVSYSYVLWGNWFGVPRNDFLHNIIKKSKKSLLVFFHTCSDKYWQWPCYGQWADHSNLYHLTNSTHILRSKPLDQDNQLVAKLHKYQPPKVEGSRCNIHQLISLTQTDERSKPLHQALTESGKA